MPRWGGLSKLTMMGSFVADRVAWLRALRMVHLPPTCGNTGTHLTIKSGGPEALQNPPEGFCK